MKATVLAGVIGGVVVMGVLVGVVVARGDKSPEPACSERHRQIATTMAATMSSVAVASRAADRLLLLTNASSGQASLGTAANASGLTQQLEDAARSLRSAAANIQAWPKSQPQCGSFQQEWARLLSPTEAASSCFERLAALAQDTGANPNQLVDGVEDAADASEHLASMAAFVAARLEFGVDAGSSVLRDAPTPRERRTTRRVEQIFGVPVPAVIPKGCRSSPTLVPDLELRRLVGCPSVLECAGGESPEFTQCLLTSDDAANRVTATYYRDSAMPSGQLVGIVIDSVPNSDTEAGVIFDRSFNAKYGDYASHAGLWNWGTAHCDLCQTTTQPCLAVRWLRDKVWVYGVARDSVSKLVSLVEAAKRDREQRYREAASKMVK